VSVVEDVFSAGLGMLKTIASANFEMPPENMPVSHTVVVLSLVDSVTSSICTTVFTALSSQSPVSTALRASVSTMKGSSSAPSASDRFW
jgi:hypothetical protein